MSTTKFYLVRYTQDLTIAEKPDDSDKYLIPGCERFVASDELDWIGYEISISKPITPDPAPQKYTPLPDWNKADKDGYIHIPDHLDSSVNKVLQQIAFIHHANKNAIQAACDIVHGLEKFFTNPNNLVTPQKKDPTT